MSTHTDADGTVSEAYFLVSAAIEILTPDITDLDRRHLLAARDVLGRAIAHRYGKRQIGGEFDD